VGHVKEMTNAKSLSEKGVTEKFVENVIGPDRFD